MFERFFRHHSTEQRYSGSGLGLAISRSVVELHGGQISAENVSTGSGLRVLVRLHAASP